MKHFQKFTFMLLTALLAVAAYAQQPREATAVPSVVKGQEIVGAQVGESFEAQTIEASAQPTTQRQNVRRADESDVLVTLPEGIVPVEQTLYTVKYTTSSEYISRPVKVGSDGTDVYIQGFIEELPDSWIKGTISGTNITFAAGQYLGTVGESDYYLNGYTNGTGASDVTMTFNAASEYYRLSNFAMISSDKTWSNYYYYYSGTRIVPTEEALTMPQTAEQSTWSFNASSYDGSAWGAYTTEELTLAFDGKDVYMKGFNNYLPDAVIKGTKNADGSLTFPTGQFLGVNDGYIPLYFVGYGTAVNEDVTFTFDGKATYTSDKYIIISAMKRAFSYYVYYSSGATISQEVDEVVVAPENLTTEYYRMSYKAGNTSTERDKSAVVNVGFDGNDVYIQGIWDGLPEAWIKGTIEDGKVKIASKQYFGSYSSTYPNVYLLNYNLDSEGASTIIDAAEFTYNAEDRSFETTSNMAVTISKTNLTYFQRYFEPRFELFPDEPATPKDPEYLTYSSTETRTSFVFSIPTQDVDGNELLTDKLAFEIYGDVEHEIAPITFSKDLYTSFTEDMTVLPYDIYDGTNFGRNTYGDHVIVLLDDMSNLNRIGVKSIYSGGGETNESNIVWYDIKDFETILEGWVAAEQGYENAQDLTTSNIGTGYTVTFDQADGNNAPKYYNSGTNARIYKNNKFTIEGKKIVKIKIQYTPNYGGVVESEPTGLVQNDPANEWVWTGEADKVDFTNVSNGSNLQLRIVAIQVFHKLTEPIDLMVITPEEGEVEELNEFTLTFGDLNIVGREDADIQLKNTETEESVNAMLEVSEDAKSVLVALENKVTAPGNYTLTIPAAALTVDGKEMPELTFAYTIAEAVEEDQLVVLPATAMAEDWHSEGAFYQWNGSSWSSYEVNDDDFSFKVAFDGDDVYIAGFDIFAPASWVKGTMVNNVLTIPAEQFTDESEEDGVVYKDYIIGFDQTGENILDIIFNYDAENQIFTLSPDVYGIGIASAKGSTNIYGYYNPLKIFKNAIVNELVTPPAGVEAEEYVYEATDVVYLQDGTTEDTPFTTTAMVAFDGNDIYVQGISKDINADTWIKGTRDGNTITFATGQWLDTYNYGGTNYDVFFLGYDRGICDLTMTYDEDNEVMTANEMIIINTSRSTISYFNIFSDATLYKQKEGDGINSITGDDANAVYFDTMGRLTNANAKGLLIKQVRMSDGTVKTVKVMRK